MHQAVYHLVHDENYQSDNYGSNHHENRRFDNLHPGGPRSLVTELVVRLLDIRK